MPPLVPLQPFHDSDQSARREKDPAPAISGTSKGQISACPQKSEHHNQEKPSLVMPDCCYHDFQQQQGFEDRHIGDIGWTPFRKREQEHCHDQDGEQSEKFCSDFHSVPSQANATAFEKPSAHASGVNS